MVKAKQLLDYLANNPDATIRYRASDMITNVHFDALNLSKYDTCSLWRYYAFAVVGTSRYLQRQKHRIFTKAQVEPTIGQVFQCRLYLGPKGFDRDT